MLRISGGTVVLSAADSNKPIAGGNRSSTKNPFPTSEFGGFALQISIYRTLNRYRAGLGKSDNLPMFVRIVSRHCRPNFNLSS